MKFDVPHKDSPMTFKELTKDFPNFVELFDGESIENTMGFYWKLNKHTSVYEFLDSESEEEVAELMGVKLCDDTVDDDEEKIAEQRQLTEDEIREFKEELLFVKSALETSGFKK
jgi:hypothetical protein